MKEGVARSVARGSCPGSSVRSMSSASDTASASRMRGYSSTRSSTASTPSSSATAAASRRTSSGGISASSGRAATAALTLAAGKMDLSCTMLSATTLVSRMREVTVPGVSLPTLEERSGISTASSPSLRRTSSSATPSSCAANATTRRAWFPSLHSVSRSRRSNRRLHGAAPASAAGLPPARSLPVHPRRPAPAAWGWGVLATVRFWGRGGALTLELLVGARGSGLVAPIRGPTDDPVAGIVPTSRVAVLAE
mmetsp:Transcript_6001/g.15473  ORF Transcript_6001/g.15473 Transcript_6001/m.15473 type:complete len:252 (-) Transcript_6001:131-886(-)